MLKNWRLVLPAHTLHSTLIPVVRIAMEHIIRRIEDRILVAPCSCICIHLHTLLYHCCLLGKSGFKLPHNLAHIPGLHHFCLGRVGAQIWIVAAFIAETTLSLHIKTCSPDIIC
nr:hypothetical protein Iba_chr13aCG0510 [Ipomoea batatas]GMD79125.1 hypothetical protein Iba_chr13dCG0810 [Ipomoea batatas]